jgi:hypothetical protein
MQLLVKIKHMISSGLLNFASFDDFILANLRSLSVENQLTIAPLYVLLPVLKPGEDDRKRVIRLAA